ncbi:TetR/AcrR family transcriptional regulator [Mycolicibacterium mucogenicum]|uniref:TetR/AcrR family transcriptional regulator n=1 Tax=Mycolicibacterium mucogenicum TaxID=56689 RepID=UPI0009F1EA20|nr:TetR/AcrR family transcriptional regulator [Mycolicibacterium mucogenicum]
MVKNDAAQARGPGRPAGSAAGHGRITQERIVHEAIELFAARGFHATGIADICRRAELKPGALYYHIGSKEDLLWVILRDYTVTALEGAEKIRRSSDDPKRKLNALIEFHVETIASHRLEVLIQMRDADALTGEHAEELQTLRRRVQACWQDVLDEGRRLGQLRNTDKTIVNALLGMLNMVATWYRPDRGESAEATAAEISTMVLRGLSNDLRDT